MRPASVPEEFLRDAESSRVLILQEIGIPGTCVPRNLRFVGAEEMMRLCQNSADGKQDGPLNFFVYMPGCGYCRRAFPEYLGAAWIAACRENDGPFYAVSSSTLRGESGQLIREKLKMRTFPQLFRVQPGGQIVKLDSESERTVSGFLRFFKRSVEGNGSSSRSLGRD